MRASEGKKTCLLFMCNARLISMKLPMEENANTFMMELHMKELIEWCLENISKLKMS